MGNPPWFSSVQYQRLNKIKGSGANLDCRSFSGTGTFLESWKKKEKELR
jgi:hypothetical protein